MRYNNLPANKCSLDFIKTYRKGFEIGLVLFFAAVIPYFPSGSGGLASYNVNIVFAIIGLGLLFKIRMLKFNKQLWMSLLFFSGLQLLLFLSFIFSKENDFSFSAIGSLMRPMFLYMYIFVFYQYLRVIKTRSYLISFMSGLSKPIIWLSVLFVVWGFLEVILGDFYLSNLLYKRAADQKHGIEFSATTFTGSTYPSGFLGLTLICLLHFISIVTKEKLAVILSFAIIIILFFTNSKPMILLGLAYFPLFIIFRMRTMYALLAVALFVIITYVFFEALLFYTIQLLESFSPSSRAAQSLLTILTNTESSGTLSVRIAQTVDAFILTKDNLYLFGAGLGRDTYLESWPAEVLYRYGGLGFLLYTFTYIVYSFKWFSVVIFERFGYVWFGLFFWFSTLLVSQLSGLLIENGKTMIFSAFMIAMLLFFSNRHTLIKSG